MPKKQGRKPPKRKPGKPIAEIDDDLATLALALDEHRLDNSANGWFEIPWRDGWNAAELAYSCWCQFTKSRFDKVAKDLATWIEDRPRLSTTYEQAESNISYCYARLHQANNARNVDRFLVAGLRCVQLTLANSSGGGVVFNDVLRLAFERVEPHWPALLDFEVLSTRCKDAIGVSPDLINDHNDKLRRAFTIAWQRGLYHAAYSLPKAT